MRCPRLDSGASRLLPLLHTPLSRARAVASACGPFSAKPLNRARRGCAAPSMRTLIITEKNNTAARIAAILSNGSMRRGYPYRVPVFAFSKGGIDYTVVGLRGHILNIDYPEELNAW